MSLPVVPSAAAWQKFEKGKGIKIEEKICIFKEFKMYSNFLNHYYLSNVHHAAAVEQTRQHLSNIFFGKEEKNEAANETHLENATLVELDRVWLRQLSLSDESNEKLNN
ncbi:MAG: hypothetical protein WCT03_22560 [Candidatus Obscuribacterales bacterium]